MAYGPLLQNPAIAVPAGRNRRRAMAFDYDGQGYYGYYEGLGWNPFKAIGSAVKAVGGAVVKGVKAVAKPAISVARTVLPAVPIVGGVAAGALDLLTRSRQSPDSSYQSQYPGTAWPQTAPILPQGQGVDILQAVKNELLRQGGQYIARTPEGQAAIRAELAAQARQRASDVGKSALPWLAAGIPLLLIATTRRR